MAYMSPAALAAASEVTELSGATVDEIQGWWTAAKAAVEAFCQQRFDYTDETRILDGNSQRRLPLDKRLATLTGIAINAPGAVSSLDLTDVALEQGDDPKDGHDAIIVRPDASTGGTWATRVLREGVPPIFPAGVGTVEVTGRWGWEDAEMPPDLTAPVSVAMLREMEDLALAKTHGLASSIRAATRLGLRSTADGRINAEIAVPDIVLSVEGQSLLEDYIWHPPGG